MTSSHTVPSHAYPDVDPEGDHQQRHVPHHRPRGRPSSSTSTTSTVEVSLCPTIVDVASSRAPRNARRQLHADRQPRPIALGKIFPEATAPPRSGPARSSGHNAARDYTTGRPSRPSVCWMMTDRLMHFDDRIDPDTGAVGRDGRIVSVRYTPANDTGPRSTSTTPRKDFDALLERASASARSARSGRLRRWPTRTAIHPRSAPCRRSRAP